VRGRESAREREREKETCDPRAITKERKKKSPEKKQMGGERPRSQSRQTCHQKKEEKKRKRPAIPEPSNMPSTDVTQQNGEKEPYGPTCSKYVVVNI
jgi:hypothetical protein